MLEGEMVSSKYWASPTALSADANWLFNSTSPGDGAEAGIPLLTTVEDEAGPLGPIPPTEVEDMGAMVKRNAGISFARGKILFLVGGLFQRILFCPSFLQGLKLRCTGF